MKQLKQIKAGEFNISLWGCLLCFIPTLIYFPNSGGSMFNLPLNLFTAGLLALLSAVALLRRWRSVRDLIDESIMTHALLLMLFCYGMAVILQNDDLGLITGILRLTGLSAIVLLWLLLGQMPLLRAQQERLIAGIVIVTTLQALLAIAQTCWPAHMRVLMEFTYDMQQVRPYGIFQQPNLLASFLATGLGCAIWLWLQPVTRSRPLLLLATVALSVALILSQSRTGIVGLALVLLVMLLASNAARRREMFKIVLVVVLAIGLALLLRLQMASGMREFAGSNASRYELLLHTLQMIAEKPFSGWGFGHFEYEFARVRMAKQHYRWAFDVKHPHNELLYQWVEGGFMALIGMGALLLAWLSPLWRCRRDPARLMLWSLTLPIMLHTMVEMPLYQSLPHLWLLLLLLHLALRTPADKPEVVLSKRVWPKRILRLSMVSVALALVPFFLSGLQTNALLTQAERGQYQTLPSHNSLWNPWIQGERYEFGEMVHCLMRYNQTQDEALLNRFLAQAHLWLKRHNDRNVYLSAVMIEWHRRNYQQARKLLSEALMLYPNEPKLQELKAAVMTEGSVSFYDVMSDEQNS